MICTPYATEEYTYVLVPCNTSLLFKLNIHFPVNFTPFLFIRRFDIFNSKQNKNPHPARSSVPAFQSNGIHVCSHADLLDKDIVRLEFTFLTYCQNFLVIFYCKTVDQN